MGWTPCRRWIVGDSVRLCCRTLSGAEVAERCLLNQITPTIVESGFIQPRIKPSASLSA